MFPGSVVLPDEFETLSYLGLPVCSLALFMMFVAAVLILSLVTGNIQIHSPGRQFLPIYLLKRNQAPQKYMTSLLVQNSSGESGRHFPTKCLLLPILSDLPGFAKRFLFL